MCTTQVARPTVSKMAYYYEPRNFDLAKGWFPFRNNHFVVNSEKVRKGVLNEDVAVVTFVFRQLHLRYIRFKLKLAVRRPAS